MLYRNNRRIGQFSQLNAMQQTLAFVLLVAFQGKSRSCFCLSYDVLQMKKFDVKLLFYLILFCIWHLTA